MSEQKTSEEIRDEITNKIQELAEIDGNPAIIVGWVLGVKFITGDQDVVSMKFATSPQTDLTTALGLGAYIKHRLKMWLIQGQSKK